MDQYCVWKGFATPYPVAVIPLCERRVREAFLEELDGFLQAECFVSKLPVWTFEGVILRSVVGITSVRPDLTLKVLVPV